MNLTIEQMRKIVDGAPERATTVRISLMADQFLYGRCENSVSGNLILLSSIRAALADHDRTDYVSDIRNHISLSNCFRPGLNFSER